MRQPRGCARGEQRQCKQFWPTPILPHSNPPPASGKIILSTLLVERVLTALSFLLLIYNLIASIFPLKEITAASHLPPITVAYCVNFASVPLPPPPLSLSLSPHSYIHTLSSPPYESIHIHTGPRILKNAHGHSTHKHTHTHTHTHTQTRTRTHTHGRMHIDTNSHIRP